MSGDAFLSVVVSVLPPLVALSSQEHAEDCDLAVHAEIENKRRTVLHYSGPGSKSFRVEMVGEGQGGEVIKRDGRPYERSNTKGTARYGSTFEADEGEVKVAARETTANAGHYTHQLPTKDCPRGRLNVSENANETETKSTTATLPARFKQAARIGEASVSRWNETHRSTLRRNQRALAAMGKAIYFQ